MRKKPSTATGANMKWLMRIGLILLTWPVATTSIARSEAQQQQDPSDVPVKLSTEMVVLDAHAINRKKGQTVAGLQKDDFVVYEDGVKQEIIHFSQDKLPLSIGLSGFLRGRPQHMASALPSRFGE
jgi:hypothetical protein